MFKNSPLPPPKQSGFDEVNSSYSNINCSANKLNLNLNVNNLNLNLDKKRRHSCILNIGSPNNLYSYGNSNILNNSKIKDNKDGYHKKS